MKHLPEDCQRTGSLGFPRWAREEVRLRLPRHLKKKMRKNKWLCMGNKGKNRFHEHVQPFLPERMGIVMPGLLLVFGVDQNSADPV